MVLGLVLTDRLMKLGYQTSGPVPKGEEALEEVRKSPPDLVLMDVKLAGEMDGICAANRIRSESDIPVVFLTAHSDKRLIESAKDSEPFGYLVKPCGDEQLGATIAVALYKAGMERRLRESEGRFRGITENATDITAVVNSAGLFTYVSPAITRVFGYAAEEVLGRPLMELAHPMDWPRLASLIRKTEGSPGKPCSIDDFRFRRVNGEWVCLDGKIVFLPDTPGIQGTVLNCRDITERKNAQELLIQSEKFKAVADMAAGVAHNFNNLLQIILWNADVALLDIQWGRFACIKNNLEQIRESCKIGAATVKRLNSFAQVPRHGEFFEKEPFDLSDLVQKAIELTEPWWKADLEEKGFTISLKSRLNAGCMVLGNKEGLFEVLVNLIKNAAEALRSGGEIAVWTGADADWVTLTVKDTGIGIEPENLSRLFTPFFTTSMEPGRGLGLATTRSIVSAHGGHMLLDSEPGKGSTVVVRFPCVRE